MSDIKWLFTITLVVMLVLNPIFSWLVSRYRREVFISMVYGFFALNILLFYLLFRASSGETLIYLGRTFYVWTAVYNLFVVSLFWGLMADLFSTEQAKRLFGFIALGGTLGAISGASITRFFIRVIGFENLFLISITLLMTSVGCMLVLTWLARRRRSVGVGASSRKTSQSEIIGGSAWSGIGLIFRSSYLLGLCLFILIYTVTSTYLYLAKIKIGQETISLQADRIVFFANIDLVANVLTVLVQLFITSRLLTRLGIGMTLAILPGISVIGFGVLAWSLKDVTLAAMGAGNATLAALVITGFESIRRASNYALARPAREVLYTVLGREEKYKSKSFIDTFVFRGGDQVGVWSHALLSEIMLLSTAAIAMVVVPLAGFWMVLALLLGRAQHQLQAKRLAMPEESTSAS